MLLAIGALTFLISMSDSMASPCSISRAVKKPNQLNHSRRIEEAAKLIASLKTAPSDDVLVYHIRLQQFTEEVEAMFRHSDPDGMDEMDGWKIHAMTKSFDQRLALLKDSTPPEILANREFCSNSFS